MASDNRRIGKVGKTQIKAVYDQVKAEAGAGGSPLPVSMQAPLFDKFLAKFLTWYCALAMPLARLPAIRMLGRRSSGIFEGVACRTFLVRRSKGTSGTDGQCGVYPSPSTRN